MHVTIVSPFDPDPPDAENAEGHAGGVERVLSSFAHHVAHRHHDVTMVCSTDGLEEEARINGHKVVRVPRTGTIFRAPVAPLARWIPEETDLIHVPATYPFTTPSVLHHAHTAGIPAVLDFHFEPYPSTPLARLAARVYRTVGPRMYEHADAVLVRSMAYGHRSPSLACVPEERWHALPNGIDPSRFNARGANGDGEHMLFVGRLVPYKGLDVLLDAMASGRLDRPLKIAGDGPLREHLEAKARRLALDVSFLGYVPEADLADLYRKAAVTVLPSVNQQECFGVTLLESMACGTPVVASDLPGVSEVASHGGFVAEPGNPRSLADQLNRALESDRLPRGDALARRIHGTFSWESLTDRLVYVYEDVLEGPSR